MTNEPEELNLSGSQSDLNSSYSARPTFSGAPSNFHNPSLAPSGLTGFLIKIKLAKNLESAVRVQLILCGVIIALAIASYFFLFRTSSDVDQRKLDQIYTKLQLRSKN